MNTQIFNLDIVILVGGFGTRLHQVIKGEPKALAEIKEHPFLEYLLNQLNKANFKRVILCTGYFSEQIEKVFGRRYKNLHLDYSKESNPLGTAGSLRAAFPLLNSEKILVMNGDSFCKIDFKKFWQFHLNKNAKASLVICSVGNTNRFGKVKLGNDESIVAFEEKRANSEIGFINAGVYLINKELVREIPEGKEMSIEKEIFPNWIGKGFYGFKVDNNFIDIGTPEDYAKAEKFFANFKL